MNDVWFFLLFLTIVIPHTLEVNLAQAPWIYAVLFRSARPQDTMCNCSSTKRERPQGLFNLH